MQMHVRERASDRSKEREKKMRKSIKQYLMAVLMCMVCICAVPVLKAEAKDVVIVLDPGHGGKEAGAYRKWSGVEYREELLNLKIALYAKAELETYDGVKVYLTRSNNSKYMDRETRIKIAKKYGANALVSIHINSTAENKTKVTGACAVVPSIVKYPNSNKYANQARALGTTILGQLKASVGLKNNGYWIDDELGIILYGMKYKVPSIIVEHCYVSNPNDCSRYLKSAASLKKMGMADAAGIAKFYNLKKKGSAAIPDHTPSVDADYVLSGWQKVGSHYYYYDARGVMQVGVTKVGGALYLLDNNGILKSGFVKLNGKQYYAAGNGKLKTGWQKYKGKKYYFSKTTGAALTKWRTIGGKRFYFDAKTGVMKTKWQTISKKKYYFSKVDGRLLKNYWLKYNGKWYYLNKNGNPYMNTKKKINGKTYKFDKKGICTNKK